MDLAANLCVAGTGNKPKFSGTARTHVADIQRSGGHCDGDMTALLSSQWLLYEHSMVRQLGLSLLTVCQHRT